MSGDRSLFVVGLPRSLSTLVYEQGCRALGLRSPRWTTAGEILNGDRVAVSTDRPGQENPKFTPPESVYACEQLAEFLDDVVSPTGSAYKDVVQPFVVSRWLAGKGLAVLRIRRPLADVALSMQRAGWWYPGRAAVPEAADPLEGLLRGLSRAAAFQEGLAGEVVEFDELLESGEGLRAALGRLYPGREIPLLDYVDDAFRERRRRMFADRQTAAWLALDERLAALAS